MVSSENGGDKYICTQVLSSTNIYSDKSYKILPGNFFHEDVRSNARHHHHRDHVMSKMDPSIDGHKETILATAVNPIYTYKNTTTSSFDLAVNS